MQRCNHYHLPSGFHPKFQSSMAKFHHKLLTKKGRVWDQWMNTSIIQFIQHKNNNNKMMAHEAQFLIVYIRWWGAGTPFLTAWNISQPSFFEFPCMRIGTRNLSILFQWFNHWELTKVVFNGEDKYNYIYFLCSIGQDKQVSSFRFVESNISPSPYCGYLNGVGLVKMWKNCGTLYFCFF